MSNNVRMNSAADLPIELDMDAIAAFCERNHIRKLSLFGSVLRDDFGPDSDIDVLVEFEDGEDPGVRLLRDARRNGRHARGPHGGPPHARELSAKEPRSAPGRGPNALCRGLTRSAI